jgi:hypothetical protein
MNRARRAAATFAIWTAIVSAILVLAGCHACSGAPPTQYAYAPSASSQSLVLQPLELREGSTDPDTAVAWGWEFDRNDVGLNAGFRSPATRVEVGDIRTHQRLWTVNGRPHESTLTVLRSWQMRWSALE